MGTQPIKQLEHSQKENDWWWWSFNGYNSLILYVRIRGFTRSFQQVLTSLAWKTSGLWVGLQRCDNCLRKYQGFTLYGITYILLPLVVAMTLKGMKKEGYETSYQENSHMYCQQVCKCKSVEFFKQQLSTEALGEDIGNSASFISVHLSRIPSPCCLTSAMWKRSHMTPCTMLVFKLSNSTERL